MSLLLQYSCILVRPIISHLVLSDNLNFPVILSKYSLFILK